MQVHRFRKGSSSKNAISLRLLWSFSISVIVPELSLLASKRLKKRFNEVCQSKKNQLEDRYGGQREGSKWEMQKMNDEPYESISSAFSVAVQQHTTPGQHNTVNGIDS